MKTKYIIFFLFLASIIIAKPNKELKLIDNKKKMLNQAYSLKKNGLIDEALKIYKDLFLKPSWAPSLSITSFYKQKRSDSRSHAPFLRLL